MVRVLKIIFENKKLSDLLSSDKKLKTEYSIKIADTIKLRLTQLEAAEHLGQIPHLPPLRLQSLKVIVKINMQFG